MNINYSCIPNQRTLSAPVEKFSSESQIPWNYREHSHKVPQFASNSSSSSSSRCLSSPGAYLARWISCTQPYRGFRLGGNCIDGEAALLSRVLFRAARAQPGEISHTEREPPANPASLPAWPPPLDSGIRSSGMDV